jgi:hypothetical protein
MNDERRRLHAITDRSAIAAALERVEVRFGHHQAPLRSVRRITPEFQS